MEILSAACVKDLNGSNDIDVLYIESTRDEEKRNVSVLCTVDVSGIPE